MDYLNIKLTTSNGLLSDFHRKKLNPLQINVQGAKDIPEKVDITYLPVYAVCHFTDGSSFRTLDLP